MMPGHGASWELSRGVLQQEGPQTRVLFPWVPTQWCVSGDGSSMGMAEQEGLRNTKLLYAGKWIPVCSLCKGSSRSCNWIWCGPVSCCGGDDPKTSLEQFRDDKMSCVASSPEPDEILPSTGMMNSKYGTVHTKDEHGTRQKIKEATDRKASFHPHVICVNRETTRAFRGGLLKAGNGGPWQFPLQSWERALAKAVCQAQEQGGRNSDKLEFPGVKRPECSLFWR